MRCQNKPLVFLEQGNLLLFFQDLAQTFSSSSLIIVLNVLNGFGPTIFCLLIKNVGVPITPACFPARVSASISALNFSCTTHLLNSAVSNPIVLAISKKE